MKRTVLLLALLILTLTSLLFPQENYRGLISSEFRHRFEDYQPPVDQQTIGTRAMAMGGANIAAVNDITALFWNPAGLTAIPRMLFTLGTKMNFASQKHDSPRFSGISVRTNVTPLLDINYAAAALPISLGSRKLVLGVAYHLRNDMNTKIENMQYYYGGGRIKELNIEKGGVQVLTPGIAFDIFSALSVGVTYSYVFGSSEYDLQMRSPYADNFLFFQFKDKEEYSGSYLDFGLQLRLTKWLTLAARMTPQWTFTVKEGSEVFKSLKPNSTELLTTETPAEELAQFDIDIPNLFGVGIGLKPGSKTTLAADVRSQKWSTIKVTSSLSEENPALSTMFDGLSWAVGFEHVLQTGTWVVPVRLGYFVEQTPYKDKMFKYYYEGKQIQREGWSTGLGVTHNKVTIDVAYTHNASEFSWWMNASDYYNQRIFTTKDTDSIVSISFTYSM